MARILLDTGVWGGAVPELTITPERVRIRMP